MKLSKATHRDGDRWRLVLTLTSGQKRTITTPDEADCRLLERGIVLALSEDAGLDEIAPFDAAADKQKWWRDTLGKLATDAAQRGDASMVARLAQSAVGFENVAKLKAAVQKLMTHVQVLQSGQAGRKRSA